jgi:pyridoxamine 5'-phosphate oxidase
MRGKLHISSKKDQGLILLENIAGAPDDPLALFAAWLAEAEASEPSDPNAMCLSTIDPDGRPSSRIVLLKGLDALGFVFYTNTQSRKGRALAAHPAVALNFHWKSLDRQVRVEGAVAPVSAEEADAYFATRGRGSRIGAWASEQSRPLASREELAQRVAAIDEKYAGMEIPRPPHWSGYRVAPTHMEFWHQGTHRLHTRIVYKKEDSGGWSRVMLNP